MRSAIFVIFLIVLGGAAFVAYNSFFIVHQAQSAIVFQFGEARQVREEPGLFFKTPFIQTVEYFDKRILDFDLPPEEAIASDQKRLVVNAFARYRIEDPLLFYQSVTNESGARDRLQSSLTSDLRSILGKATFTEIVRDRRAELMGEIARSVEEKVKPFGMKIIDVRLTRVDLPEANSQAIYERMKTERQQEAAEIRAKGTEQATRIRAQADRRVTVLLAEANRDAERTRGEGDGERNRIYAEAFSKDADFFAFYRSMQAYEEGLKSDDTRLVISPNTEFFQYFTNPDGVSNAAGSGTSGSGTSGSQTSQALR
jgi:modulator of FtsH protease HflC